MTNYKPRYIPDGGRKKVCRLERESREPKPCGCSANRSDHRALLLTNECSDRGSRGAFFYEIARLCVRKNSMIVRRWLDIPGEGKLKFLQAIEYSVRNAF